MPGGLGRLNRITRDEAAAVLQTVCGSRRWLDRMLARRAFAGETELFNAAESEWFGLAREDWIEAFSHHPRIGERDLAQAKFAPTEQQSSREQSGMAGASDAERAEFAAKNAEYERKFGHVFLICATGKSAAEMLASLRSRLGNDAETELRNAAAEQAKIMRLRLERWLAS
ncbi:MAG: 2-oxo-4-hydroxy-4-carboxy-5-ureidoimidazoline decarboxylase [Phycisphaerales bacterium]